MLSLAASWNWQKTGS